MAGLEAYKAQRKQNTARTGGKRPGLPPEPAPQVRVATIGCVAAVVPLPEPPVLGGGHPGHAGCIVLLGAVGPSAQ